ncbi:general amino acid permease [Suhomyces tanzawaensis NRRL Y-17324]|uniref:General amino acid permease n=1 Tax=Suhomyces tanzawaensis NRRL Y-17324 TaxID=984487 RepID=A0A1E4SI18_9ASCO|nr:general amino acid permease [Suhomyces tanzawaensis NRRL Y-17324]ODV79145.1 general amino acid permease [Suhomyces tanzawaensis NRRL Y-17324]
MLKQDEYFTKESTSSYDSAEPVGKWKEFTDSFRRQVPGATNSGSDIESLASQSAPDLQKGLKKRQLQMIALGGCVGSGLLVASGLALTNGPGAVLVAWAIVSTFLYCTMQSLAELVSVFPVSGSFATYATRFIDPSWGFAMGWNYAIFWVIVLPLELVAASLTINFWKSSINSVVWVAVFYVLIILLNLCGNKGFGEAEFIASVIKLLGIVGFDILAIVLICGGGDEGYIGGKYWHNPGAFTTGFKGVVSVLITATYSLAGTELIGLTASESKENPRKMMPKAIKQVFWRIIVFYMITLTLVGFLVPANSPKLIGSSSNASASPFVIAIRNGGIKALPSIFNVIVLVALLAIGNSAVYGFSRTALALSEQGLAPKFLGYIDRNGRPLGGILFSAFIGLLAFVAASPKQSTVFAWLVALSGLSTLFTWGSINASFIQFRRAMAHQGRTLDELPYVSNTGVIGAYYGLIMNILVLCLQFWISLFPLHQKPDATVFFQNYIGAVVVLAFYVGHKIYSRNLKFLVNISDIDVDAGRGKTDIDMLKQEIAEEKRARAALSWYKRYMEFWC